MRIARFDARAPFHVISTRGHSIHSLSGAVGSVVSYSSVQPTFLIHYMLDAKRHINDSGDEEGNKSTLSTTIHSQKKKKRGRCSEGDWLMATGLRKDRIGRP